MKKNIFRLALMLSMFVQSVINAQEITVSNIQDSGCQGEPRANVRGKYGGRETIILTKEGTILTVQLLNYEAECGIEDFDVRPSMGGGSDGSPSSVSIHIVPVGYSDEDCYCLYNISFTLHNLETSSFRFSCWWYDGQVELSEGEPLILEEEIKLDYAYAFDNVNHTAVLKNGSKWSGDFNIPSKLEYEGETYTVTGIGMIAFVENPSLTSVTIPNSVTSIGELAFGSCIGLTNLYCQAENVPNTASNAFAKTPITSATLHVPASAIEAYKTNEPWRNFGKIVTLTTQVNSILNDEPSVSGQNYDLQGRKLPNKPSRGIYIEDGKKKVMGK